MSDTVNTDRIPSSQLQVTGRVETRDIGGIEIAVLTQVEALATLSTAFATRRHVKLAFCNANLVNLATADPALRRDLCGFLILPDGIGIDIGSLLLHAAPFPVNLNGTDFTPALLHAEMRPLRVGLIGGKPGVATAAAAQLALDHPRHRFEAISHGYFDASDEAGVLARLEAAPPDLLLVAFGNPHQEKWIARKLKPRHGTVIAGVGALFDFVAGGVPRAPRALRGLRLEWAYRLWLEPGRLWRRYVLGNPLFVLRMLKLTVMGPRHIP